MGEAVKTLLRNLFVNGWQRKGVAILIALIIWLVVNHSLTTVRTLTNVPVKVINIPAGKTVQGLGPNDYLLKKATLTLTGNQTILEEITANDLEVQLDAADMDSDDWNAEIKKKNLRSLNPEIDINKVVSRVTHGTFFVHLTHIVTEKIKVVVNTPTGNPPRGYEVKDIWPYKFEVTVSGPENAIKSVKGKPVPLTFDLSEITHEQLDALQSSQSADQKDVISFFVPDMWKQVSIPLISVDPIQLNDPLANFLRIDFVHRSLQPIDFPVSVSVFYPPELAHKYNPETIRLAPSECVAIKDGIAYLKIDQLCAKGGTVRFVKLIRNRMHVRICINEENGIPFLTWSLQFVNPQMLEQQFVKMIRSDASESEDRDVKPQMREEYIANRFRSYIQRMVLFTADDVKLELKLEMKDGQIIVHQDEL